jgi:DNA-binding MarR family transcriptional regulator
MKQKEQIFSVDTAEDSSGFLLWQVTVTWQRGIKKVLQPLDITHPQFVLLASLLWLQSYKADITQVHLSEHSKVDVMTTSSVIKTLLRKGLVERKEHAVDSRAKVVSISTKGLKITRDAITTIEDFDKQFFAALKNDTPAFKKLLQQLINQNTTLDQL